MSLEVETKQFRPAWDLYRFGKIYWTLKDYVLYTVSYGEQDEDLRVIEALDTSSGKSLWKTKLGKGEYDKSIFCTDHYLLVNTEKQIRVIEPATGKEMWTIHARSKEDITMAARGERLYAVLRPGFLSVIDLDKRKVLWEAEFFKASSQEEIKGAYVGSINCTDQGSIILKVGAWEKSLFLMLEPGSGRCIWKSPLPIGYASSFAYDGKNLIVQHRDRIISLDPGSWRRVWAYDDRKPFESDMVNSGSMLYIVDSNGSLLALRSSDGKVCWSRPLPGAENFSLTMPAFSGTPIIAVSEGTVSAFSSSGEILWQFSPGLGKEIEIQPVKTSEKPEILVKSSSNDCGIACFIMGAEPKALTISEEKRRRAAEIVDHIERLTPLRKKELLSMGDEGFNALFAAMRKILIEADPVIHALNEQAGKKEGSSSFIDSDDLNKKKKSKLYSERYYAISDLISRMTAPRHTEQLFTLLDELRTDEARAPVLCLLAEYGEGKRKEDLLLGIVQHYLELYSNKRDLYWMDNLDGISLVYLEHSNDSRVFEILLSALEDEKAPEEVRRLALCRLPFMGDRRGVDAVLRLRKKETRILPSLDEAMKTEKLAQAVRETPCFRNLKKRWVAPDMFRRIKVGECGEIFPVQLNELDKKDDGVIWAFVVSSLAGFVEDVWALRLCDGEEPRAFYTGLLGYTYKQSDIDRVLRRDVLSHDSDGDGWTDLLEKSIGTDPNKADTDGDGLIDSRDRNPTSAPREPGDEEKIIHAVFEAWFLFDRDHNMLSVLELPEGIKPFELLSAPWVTVTRGHGKRNIGGRVLEENAGTAITKFEEIKTDFSEKPIISSQRNWILWSDDHRKAKVHYFILFATLNGIGFDFILEKIGDEWFVKKMELTEAS